MILLACPCTLVQYASLVLRNYRRSRGRVQAGTLETRRSRAVTLRNSLRVVHRVAFDAGAPPPAGAPQALYALIPLSTGVASVQMRVHIVAVHFQ